VNTLFSILVCIIQVN